MPIVEKDPWRTQYFDCVSCPDDVIIPTDDELAYRLYPAERWVYNKLLICETQGVDHGPHGTVPPRFPVFSKPIYNLRGMGVGGRVMHSAEELEGEQAPGHMWMRLLSGRHVSTDVAVVNGVPRWWRHTTGTALNGGMFDYWTVLAKPEVDLEAYLGAWLGRCLTGYTGLVNFETIGGTIIECHLRFADQWPDLYGPGWVESLVRLYARREWSFADDARATGYSVVLFGKHGQRYAADPGLVTELRRLPAVSSIQITFHADKPPEEHAMPPGGFRLAIVNCWDLATGFLVRERLAAMFGSARRVGSRPTTAAPAPAP